MTVTSRVNIPCLPTRLLPFWERRPSTRLPGAERRRPLMSPLDGGVRPGRAFAGCPREARQQFRRREPCALLPLRATDPTNRLPFRAPHDPAKLSRPCDCSITPLLCTNQDPSVTGHTPIYPSPPAHIYLIFPHSHHPLSPSPFPCLFFLFPLNVVVQSAPTLPPLRSQEELL